MKSPFLPDWVFAHAERNPDSPAVASPETRLSYRELAERVRALSALLGADGVGPGERVVIALPNLPAAVVAGLAVQTLGACAVELSREWGADALRVMLGQIRPRHAFVLGRDAHIWGEVARAKAGKLLRAVLANQSARAPAREEGPGARSVDELPKDAPERSPSSTSPGGPAGIG